VERTLGLAVSPLTISLLPAMQMPEKGNELQYPPRERVHPKLSINENREDQNKSQRNCPIASFSIGIHCFLSVTLCFSALSFKLKAVATRVP